TIGAAAIRPAAYGLVGSRARDPVAFLDEPQQLVAPSHDDGQIVAREPAPSRSHPATQMRPVARELLPVHDLLLVRPDPHGIAGSRAGLSGQPAPLTSPGQIGRRPWITRIRTAAIASRRR